MTDIVKSRELRISPDQQGARLDVYLVALDPDLSRSQLKRLIDEEQVLVNGKGSKAGYKLRAGDVIRVTEQAPAPCQAVPENIPLTILYEDKDLLVVDKAAGMVVHPAAGNYQHTLVNAILHHCKDLTGIGGVLRPGIVHRLDKNTSGLMVVAKTDSALAFLQQQFKAHEVKKIYKALAFGDLTEDEGVIDVPIGRHPTDRKKMSMSSKRGKEALTRWRVLERYGILTYLELRIETGRTHQIRVHLNGIGHPILGDDVYGNGAKRLQTITDNAVQSCLKMMKRQALHAATLAFKHPQDKRWLEFSSEPPEDMTRTLCFMRNYMDRKYDR